MADAPVGKYDKLSLGATVRSSAVEVNGRNVSWAVRTTGTAEGTWLVQYSPDFVPGVDDPTSDAKWDTYTLDTDPPAATGSAQTFGVVVDQFEFKYARMKFVRTAGTGTGEFWSLVTGG